MGDYYSASQIYDALLEDPDFNAFGDELCCALFSNCAFCCLKLSTVQSNWTLAKQLLRRTVRLCDQALAIDSRNTKAYFRRGCALEALERYVEAVKAYERALELEPGDPRIRSGLTRAVRYLQFAHGPERAAKIERAARGKNLKGKASLAGPKAAAPATYDAFWRCSAKVQGEGYFAAPCGHGPFCGQCKAFIERDGNGLPICTVCRQHPAEGSARGIIDRWEVGLGQLVQARPAKELLKEAMSTGRPWAFGDETPNEAVNDTGEGASVHNADCTTVEVTPLTSMD